MAKIILIRHGESFLNQKKVYFGHSDPKLTSKGISQIENLKNSIPLYDYIFSSPSIRALETARLLNIENKPIVTDSNLMEINFGNFEGLCFDEISTLYPQEIVLWKNHNINYKFPEGESIWDLGKRCECFFDKLKTSNETFLIITHSGIINSFLSLYLTGTINNFWNFQCSLGSMSTIELYASFAILKNFSLSFE
ncbi:MAG: histidine phosphatase family protein [Fusobacteriaceae bacterium]|nr:histidine phosphatase family protein [Fusobacteriaceae bacterium]